MAVNEGTRRIVGGVGSYSDVILRLAKASS